tara:strand:+ start:2142 stop:4184 length:2043 start_codon:yes stop_codon:yes gene_type:complete
VSDDSKKKTKQKRARPLEPKSASPAKKGAVPLAGEPKKKQALALDTSQTVELGADFLDEQTNPEAQSLTIENANLHTEIDLGKEQPPPNVKKGSAAKSTQTTPEKKRAMPMPAESAAKEIFKPQSHIKKPPSAQQRQQKQNRAQEKPGSPKVDLDAIDNLPSARVKKSSAFSSKRKKVDQQQTKAAPRFTGIAQDLESASTSFEDDETSAEKQLPEELKPPPKSTPTPTAPPATPSSRTKAKKVPPPPSKEKLSHATQIFLQDALAAVDLLDEKDVPSPSQKPMSKKTSPPKSSVTQSKVSVPPQAKKLPPPQVTQKRPVAPPPPKVSEPTQVSANALVGGDVTTPGGDALPPKSKAERIEREFGRALDGPEAKRAEDREGKVLRGEPDRYQQDNRPLAYRGAWWVGQPDIRPKRLPKMMRGVLKRSRGEKRILWGSLVGAFFAGLLLVGPEFFNPSAQAMSWQKGIEIQMSSSPSGAKIFLAGKLLGETPLAIRKDLSPGEYELRLEHGEMIPVVEQLSVAPQEKNINLHFPLVDFSTLDLTSEPKGAVVHRDGKEVGETPLTLKQLPLNTDVVLEFHRQGYDVVTLRLPKVRPVNEKRHIQMYQEKNTGKVTLQSTKELLIFNGSKRIGVTGPLPIELPAGKHRLQLVEPITGQQNDYYVRVVSKATRRYYFEWSDVP